ncbi:MULTISPECIES: biotin--[acetyl-CoA-carboxylase] ligase [Treponema]|nr:MULTISPECIES: biotin--[acetyl-CoA-carboxylase] ligase [Treponema]AEH40300.1 biotin--[acetyl-CoA-carboxylase] ligase [Treponema paraluiscuniculi Cuniculi A]AEZ57476.1 biotin--[acetyl-CoA-carboxylase] ligase [Treponema pallidum subsp. pertenue str. SamoaD]AEZ58545.1 biotin--[acetyl-CoA-carboxylase] ligase [Treponema pallidum subsp. pertenue str. CDC2]AEZ59613.1 biotin--[acetyl-CoA-carboxylase] ligase [Treponema pallidum subsp. pertenue str. Gauthier]AEZ60677.1 biotin--[acetyl-CoA-carboxylase]
MDEAASRAQGCEEGAVFCAGEQVAGRGRGDQRKWQSEPGKNLLCTVVLRRVAFPAFSLCVGYAVALAYMAFLGGVCAPRIKWPNDVLVCDRKIAGVLCQVRAGALLVGIGCNLLQVKFPPELSHACSLAQIVGGERCPDPFAFLPVLLDRLYACVMAPPSIGVLESCLWKQGEYVCFRECAGTRPPILGRVVGLAADGALCIDSAGSMRSYYSGEIAFW